MSYVVMEFLEGIGEPVSEKFPDQALAEDERVYLQPDFDYRLKTIKIKDIQCEKQRLCGWWD